MVRYEAVCYIFSLGLRQKYSVKFIWLHELAPFEHKIAESCKKIQ